jgi:hypothetical protein
MASFTTNKNLEKPANGEYVDQWDVPLNGDMNIIDAAFGGVTSLNATSGSANLSTAANTSYLNLALNITGAISANVIYTIPSGVGGSWVVRNATTDATGGPWSVIVASGGGGSNVAPLRGKNVLIWSDGTNIRNVDENVESIGTVTSVAVSGGTTGLTANGSPITTNGTITLGGVLNVASGGTNLTAFGTGVSGALSANAIGTGAMVLQSNATLITPAIGTPSSGNLVNTTGLPIANTTGTLAVNRGGTGSTTLTANNLLVGNGTSSVAVLAPGTTGNVVTSNGTHWNSQAFSSDGRLIRAPQVLTSGVSYTTPVNCTDIYVEAVGGGGGGGGADVTENTATSAAGGGGSGGYSAKYFAVTGNTAYTYAIGAGGAGGAANGGANGVIGQNTTFTVSGVTITAAGGGFGSGAGNDKSGDNLSPGGEGGTASNGDINVSGNIGSTGFQTDKNRAIGGNGGPSYFGGSGRGGTRANGTASLVGNVTVTAGTFGGGGGGAATGSSQSGTAGGAGGNGVIRIWEFT